MTSHTYWNGSGWYTSVIDQYHGYDIEVFLSVVKSRAEAMVEWVQEHVPTLNPSTIWWANFPNPYLPVEHPVGYHTKGDPGAGIARYFPILPIELRAKFVGEFFQEWRWRRFIEAHMPTIQRDRYEFRIRYCPDLEASYSNQQTNIGGFYLKPELDRSYYWVRAKIIEEIERNREYRERGNNS